MSKLSDFLQFICKHHLEAAARETIRVSREADFPLMRKYRHLSVEELLPASMKNIVDLAESFSNGTYLSQQKEMLLKMEKEAVSGISKEEIEITDLVMVFAVRRIAFRKFLPDYTRDIAVSVEIMNELEYMHLELQELTFNSLFKWKKQKEEELRKSNMFLSAVLENIPDMIFVKDAKDLRFVVFNKAGENLLGYSREDLSGKNDYDFFPKEQADFFIEKDRDVLRNKQLLNIEEEPIRTRNRGERWLHTQKIPLLDKDGNPEYLLGISADISEKKKTEDAMRELNKELEAFSYSVSHDLRAPLRAINGYSQILVEDFSANLNEEAAGLLQTIMQSAQKMNILIDELLDFSKLGRKEVRKTKVDMNVLVADTLKEYKESNPHNASISCGDLPPAWADPALLRQVLLNLFSNAIKYSSKKQKPEITVSGKTEGENVYYTVSDNGAGFSMQYADKLFGVFQRLHLPDEFEGVGVGLAIVKRIISKHGGEVSAEGKKDAGASFSVSVPIEPNAA